MLCGAQTENLDCRELTVQGIRQIARVSGRFEMPGPLPLPPTAALAQAARTRGARSPSVCPAQYAVALAAAVTVTVTDQSLSPGSPN